MTILSSMRGAGFRSARVKSLAAKSLAMAAVATALMGCESLDTRPSHSAGWSLLDPSQRHPIMVSQQPHTLSLNVSRGQNGLSPHQRAQFYNFVEKYRSRDGGNSKIVISVPAGSANETSAMHAVADLRPMLLQQGIAQSDLSIEPYQADGGAAPIKVSYMRFQAEGPECGRWPDNLAESKRNTNYHNFGCTQQKNLAAQVANPADLLGPRTMTPADGDRRDVVYQKYIKGQVTSSDRNSDERVAKNR